MDVDHSGSLDRPEFIQVMTVLCSNVLTRVMAQWTMTLVLVPLMAQYILSAILWAITFCSMKLTELENYDEIIDSYDDLVANAKDWIVEQLPAGILLHIDTMSSTFSDLIDSVPKSVYSTIPVTLMSCILGIIFVPYTIFTIDEFFASLADRKKKEKKRVLS